MKDSIAKGSALTPETYADFVTRLRYHCDGEGVNDHCTADAIFIVEKRVIDYGLHEDYSDNICIYYSGDDGEWHSFDEFWSECDRSAKATLNNKSRAGYGVKFSCLGDWLKEAVLEDAGYTITRWRDRWEYVNSHFTKEAAEAWIKRKGHDYPEGLRVYVDAQLYCWEWNAIKEAILSGKLVFKV